MKLLAVDTSGPRGAIGICEEERVLGALEFESAENFSTRLLPAVARLLEESRLAPDDIDVFGAVVGPGSFTGLRVGMATIKGLAWSRKKPMVGLVSLEVLARNVRAEGVTLAPMLDARKGRVYGALYAWRGGRLETRSEPADVDACRLIERAGAGAVAFGSGARKHLERLSRTFGPALRFAPEEADAPKGAELGRLALEVYRRGGVLDPVTSEPLYLRPSEAEMQERRTAG